MKSKRKLLFELLFCTLIANTCFSQTELKKAKKIFKEADEAFGNADYMKAYQLYGDGLKYDTANYEAVFRSGLSLFNMNKTDGAAIKYFTKATGKIPEAHFYLGRTLHMKGESKKALEEFYYYKNLNRNDSLSGQAEEWIKKCEAAIVQESQKDYYSVKNLGGTINTQYPEYVPLIWKFYGGLVFTSRRPGSTGGLKDPYGKYYEDIYLSKKIAGNWSQPKSLSDEINTATHDACVAFSADGKELIIYRTDEAQTGGDLYITKYDSAKWSVPVMLGPEINSEYLEASACFAPSGGEIIFSSNRPGGYGGKDLYRVIRFMNGKYSMPHNLGPGINTSEEEDAPFIDKNKTLYFSSRGHNSMGEFDIFKAQYNYDLNNWTTVENMGQPLNSTNDDIYFIRTDNPAIAYFTSRRAGGYGDADIYEVNFSVSEKEVVYYKLIPNGLEPAALDDIQLSLIDAKTGTVEGIYNPGRSYLNAILLVTKNKPYELQIEGSGIAPISQKISFGENDKEIKIELYKKTE